MKRQYCSYFILSLFIVFFANACSKLNDTTISVFPTEIVIKHREKPIESVIEFIDDRYEILNSIVESFSKYIFEVGRNGKNKHKFFDLAYPLQMEDENSTSQIVNKFKSSSSGAYLNKIDKEYLRRYLKEKKKQNEDLWKKIYFESDKRNDEDSNKLELYKIDGVFKKARAAKKLLEKLTYDDYLSISRFFYFYLKKQGNIELWKIYSSLDRDLKDKYISEYKKSYPEYMNPYPEKKGSNFDVYCIDTFVWGSEKYGSKTKIKTIFNGKVEIGKFYWQNKYGMVKTSFGASLVIDVLKQSFFHYPFGYVLVTLKDTGMNDYLGVNLLNDIASNVIKSIEQVKKETQELDNKSH